MNFEIDVHTHTIASGHAYSTLQENLIAAKKKGLKVLGVSDHAPGMPGSAYIFHFQNLRVLPKEVEGVRLLRGVEVNILSVSGQIDMTKDNLEGLDYAIASLHPPCFRPGSKKESTQAVIRAMDHKKVKIIGHPDDQRFPLDYEEVVRASKDTGVLLEINNSSINPEGFRVNAKENIMRMLDYCARFEVAVICGSDAHISYDVGNFNYCKTLIESCGFPTHLLMNTDKDKFLKLVIE